MLPGANQRVPWRGERASVPIKETQKVTSAIVIDNLSKSFEDVRAVEGASFEVARSELFGFLGPNGAGKTTTINMLTGLARPDTGSISIGGIDCTENPRAAQHLVGVVPDESNLYPELTGFDNLCFCASLYGVRKADRQARARELLQMFGLTKAADRKFAGYSRGMKRKLTIAAGIIHRPEILFLDEPTTGIDVASARQLRQLIDDLNQRGTTIFLTTHYIEEAERLCDRVAFIVSGQIIRIDSVENLVQPVKSRHIVQIACTDSVEGIRGLIESSFPDLDFVFRGDGTVRVESDQPIGVGPIIRLLEDNDTEVIEARRIRPSLEEVFVRATGLEADAMQKEKEKKGGGR